MPVQDSENKRTAENSAVSAEEELRKKQENNVWKSGKLLPFLNAKAVDFSIRFVSSSFSAFMLSFSIFVVCFEILSC